MKRDIPRDWLDDGWMLLDDAQRSVLKREKARGNAARCVGKYRAYGAFCVKAARCYICLQRLKSLQRVIAVTTDNPTVMQAFRQKFQESYFWVLPGINIDVAADLEANFAWAPPLATQTQNIDDDLAGPESISLDEIDVAFALLEHEKEVMEQVLDDGNEVLEGQVYDFAELEHVDQGLLPKSVDDEVIVVDHTSHDDRQWDVDMLMSCNGVS
ncbi:hypothetical protein F4604DRAFT_1906481 [Suillus subluteus]|nr:hypothetical protein F4604DRAFT_1906481 [Suillus subluteus]